MKKNKINLKKWHVFCRVIDNYGDAGVSFRLARQLANEFDIDVTLWIDNLNTLARIQPQVNPQLDEQTAANVDIRRLTNDIMPPTVWPNVIIDAFGGGLPPRWLDALRHDFPVGNTIPKEQKPLWIVLEYLSAESFVDEMHGMASPPPDIGIERRFFFPGFTERSGGLLRENDLICRRDRFLQSAATRKSFLASLGAHSLPEDHLLVSLFCYETPQLPQLLTTWQQSTTPITLLVPAGVAEKTIRAWQQDNNEQTLRIIHIPFLAQNDYDRLLWLCDLNFVRGEDSLVRAIWAGKPFIWQAYRQKDSAHHGKVEALLAQIGHIMPSPLDMFTRWWNGMRPDSFDVTSSWNGSAESLAACSPWARSLADHLTQQPHLAKRLLQFAGKRGSGL